MFVLDTNTLIYFFKGQGRVAENLWQQLPQDIGIPTIVLFELHVGIGKSSAPEKRLGQLNEMLSVVNVLPFNQAEANIAAQIRVALKRKGEMIGPYDILIAATALTNRSILVTRNTREFSCVENLSLVDWF
ncbi:MAG: type II toxin-antitoxin system VapC family toxin [Anaerolineales bacterium]|nr:type II toxin-antitoxin system VapC family toxin [Anaerolineales bacterium]